MTLSTKEASSLSVRSTYGGLRGKLVEDIVDPFMVLEQLFALVLVNGHVKKFSIQERFKHIKIDDQGEHW